VNAMFFVCNKKIPITNQYQHIPWVMANVFYITANKIPIISSGRKYYRKRPGGTNPLESLYRQQEMAEKFSSN